MQSDGQDLSNAAGDPKQRDERLVVRVAHETLQRRHLKLRCNLDPDALVDEMVRQSVKVEAKILRLLNRNGITLSPEEEEALHSVVMGGVGAELEAEGALTFLVGHSG